MPETDLIERLKDTYTAWNNAPSEFLPDDAGVLLEASAALSEKDKRIGELEAALVVQRESKEYAQRCCIAAERECDRLRTRLASAEKEGERMREALQHERDKLAERLQAEQWSHEQSGRARDEWRKRAEFAEARLADKPPEPAVETHITDENGNNGWVLP